MVPAEGGNSEGVPVVVVDEVLVAGAGGFHFNYRGGVQLECPAAGCVLEVENPYYSLIVIWKGQTPTRKVQATRTSSTITTGTPLEFPPSAGTTTTSSTRP